MIRLARHLALVALIILAQPGCAAVAQAADGVDGIAPKPLATALTEFATKTGLQIVYRAELARSVQSPGAPAGLSAEETLEHLLRGTGLTFERINATTLAVVPKDAGAALPRSATDAGSGTTALDSAAASGSWNAGASGGLLAQQSVPAPPTGPLPAPIDESGARVEEVLVLGSRIPRLHQEGPTPVTSINAEQIRADGYTTVPDLLRALTQNGGETQSQQSFSGASFTPGAQQVDLRGLGPNHTLVLVNGRRVADFPLPFKGKSNFTDISNIPVSMIESVDVLSGSASAIYGSDAIAGVVNFKLKREVDGTTVDVRYGNTELGGGGSQRLAITSGWNSGAFHAVFGAELLNQEPLWAWNRSIQDSTTDSPSARTGIPRRVFLRIEPVEDVYVDPGAATCASLASLNGNSTIYASRPNWGPDGADGFYCGSAKSISYGTIISGRRGITGYASLSLDLSDRLQAFADIQYGLSKVRIFTDVLDWQFEDANGNEDGIFYNSRIGALDSWYRQFTPEEMGGFARGMIRNNQETFSITPGLKGTLGEGRWHYEAYLNHSQYQSKVSWPEIIRDKANALFLGPQLGVDPDSGYPVFNADPARLYTPLTPAEYNSIATLSTYLPKSRTDSAQVSLDTPQLFRLPAGPVGFAAVVEAGSQSYRLNPDPLALSNYYYALRDADGSGTRNHWGAGLEARLPIVRTLEGSLAGRYDSYHFAGSDTGKFTYNLGLLWRPLDSLLLRAAYGTGFRAPDLHYVFAGPGNTHPSATDYFLCRTQEPTTDIGDCSYADEGIVESRVGNRQLKSETSSSLSYGIVWAPTRNISLSLDFFRIDLDNEVLDMNIDTLLRVEANCRIGQTDAGTPVDVNSPTCQDALTRVHRYPLSNPVNPNGLIGVSINPVNVAREHTSGFDFSTRLSWPTPIGELGFNGGYTYVDEHTLRQYPGDPLVNEFQVDSNYDIPRSKATASLSWKLGAFTTTLLGERLDRLPNWNEDAYIPATYLVNGSLQWAPADSPLKASLSMTNLLNKMPYRDPSYQSYPYYDISWFDSVGRSYYLNLTYHFGGH
ncbi:MAG: TonB-dependent receptor [Proteobacteria bacterium]|nr:TonB-dependent receptor [Pseudomonadota bacterium]